MIILGDMKSNAWAINTRSDVVGEIGTINEPIVTIINNRLLECLLCNTSFLQDLRSAFLVDGDLVGVGTVLNLCHS